MRIASSHSEPARRAALQSTIAVGALTALVVLIVGLLTGPLGLGVIALVTALPVLVAVFTSAKAAFVVLTVSIVVAGSELAAGPVRILDLLLLVGVLGLAVQTFPSRAGMRTEHWLVLLAIVSSLMVALGRGNSFELIAVDLHLFAVPLAVYLIASRAVATTSPRFIVLVLTAAAVAAAVKAVMVAYLGGVITEGPESLWQAYATEGSLSGRRIILIGGDTIIVMGAALCALCRRTRLLGGGRWMAGVVLCGLAVAITGTRTNIVVAVVALLTVLALSSERRWSVERMSLPAGVVVAGLVLVFALTSISIQSGGRELGSTVAQRLTARNLVDNSLDYRRNEQHRLLSVIQGHALFGLGAGSTYFTQLSAYAWGEALWTHNAALWLMLKSGLLGALSILAALILVIARATRNLAATEELQGRLVIVGVLGVVGLSVTTNRLTDPGGALLLATCFALAAAPVASGEERT